MAQRSFIVQVTLQKHFIGTPSVRGSLLFYKACSILFIQFIFRQFARHKIAEIERIKINYDWIVAAQFLHIHYSGIQGIVVEL